MKALKFSWLVLIICLPQLIKAQQYYFKNYSAENGLPFVQVFCMYQDKLGYLWSGGYGGLSRFDGKTFKNYTKKDGLVDNYVNAVCEDDSSALYVASNKGINVLKNGKVQTNLIYNLNGLAITSLCKGYHHSVYVGTNKGLYIISNGKVRPVSKIQNHRVNCVYKLDSSIICVGTENGLYLYGHKTFKHLTELDGLPSNNVNCITKFNNELVIGTQKGLSFYNLKLNQYKNYKIENGLIDENIKTVLAEGQNLWIGSNTGLIYFNQNQFYYIGIYNDNNSNYIRCLLSDAEGNVWIGTHTGLFRYRDKAFVSFDKISGPGNAFVYGIIKDKQGVLWLTTENNGLYSYYQSYFKRYGTKDGLIGNVCRTVSEFDNHQLLFGFENGLMLFDNNKFKTVSTDGLTGPFDFSYKARNGSVYMGHSNGVTNYSFKNGNLVTKTHYVQTKNGFSPYGFAEDEQGHLWIGTYGNGLYRLKNDSIKKMNKLIGTNEENFFSNVIIYNTMFAGTLSGLAVYDLATNKFKYLTEADGLNSDLIYSLKISRNKKNLWIGTNQGVNVLDLEKYFNSNKVEIKSYGKSEGFTGVECNSGGIYEDIDGTIWFGTVSGIVKHEPFSVKTNTVQNSTVIQKIQINSLDTLLQDGAKLPYDYNNITFKYRGICLTNPDKVLYIKKLEGLDKEWSLPSSDDDSKYLNLPPRKYVFKVKSCNNEGVWNSVETQFAFEIKRPFYFTIWFILLCITFVVLVIIAIFRVRLARIRKKQKLEFERKVEMSKVELKALRSQMNPHFVFNSLNSIQHYIYSNESDEAIKYLNKFARLVRIILNNSEKPTVTIEEDLEALKLYLELEQMRFEGKFESEIKVDENVDTDYDIMPPLLMQPYVENAILHGLNPLSYKGKLSIHLSIKDNFLVCVIEDNGIGRDKAREITHSIPGKKHKSLGMKITEDRLRILNDLNNSTLSVNIIDLKDEKGMALGTRVELFVPLNN